MTSACKSCATTPGEIGFSVYVGGGLGRTPMIGRKVRDFLPERDLLGYVEAILRVYNMEGRRDNKFKARIKILVHEKGLEALREEIEAEFAARDPKTLDLPAEEVQRIRAFFAPPELESKKPVSDRVERRKGKDARFMPASSPRMSWRIKSRAMSSSPSR